MADFFDSKTESSRCLHCAKPHCVGSCPVGNDIPQLLRLVREGKEQEAVRLVGHPFGEVCGYVCPHDMQCVGNCVLSSRGKGVDTGAVEREIFARHPYEPERRSDMLQGCKIAVVGGGVAGLTFASEMYSQGADVTVYERDRLLSTLWLIPDFRLPREALTRIEEQLSGKFHIVKQTVDSAFTEQLAGTHDIVYIASGACKSYTLGIDGEHFSTPYADFLDQRSELWRKNADLKGKKVIVIGGGNTAMDCARLALRYGAQVTVAYRRTRRDMPAFNSEIAAAEAEGANFRFNVAPLAVRQNGSLAVTLAETESKGRGKLTITDKTHATECDLVVTATGGSFDRSILKKTDGDSRHPYGNVYVGGDAAGGGTVARAVRDALDDAHRLTSTKR